ncbi:sulfatase [Salipiger abyssi]|uniref:sulfatase n=1 Tax=Salipiger abyssi TaxID=1250539 RepID=UPI001A8FFFCA|nr:sulfatase [Salipiger abyssi]MBN9888688.1 sulfatase [Salipiger abyssi]
MRTIFVLFDSLNRHALGCYGGSAVPTPNFDRFAKKAQVFDNHYVGSLPCMPARRDMQTGRLNFLHRSWGPLEPFDNSYARLLSQSGTYMHLITDHAHYFEDGGAGYATGFDSWEFIRGQENDPIKAMVEPPYARMRDGLDPQQYPFPDAPPDGVATSGNTDRNTWARSRAAVNGLFRQEEADYPLARCFASALEYLEINRDADNWFLQLECFDPHEPFTAPARYREAVDKRTGETGYEGGLLDWPNYERVTETPEQIAEMRANYAALVTMCDAYFGRLLDWMDAADAWDDTAIVLTTDHGYLLGEHEWWAKSRMPYYQEIAHIPLVVWLPGQPGNGARAAQLTQTTDLMPTFLGFHGVPVPAEVRAHSLMPVLEGGSSGRESAILGMFGGPVCVTDGRYTYFRFPEKGQTAPPLYTLMPAHMAQPFSVEDLRGAEMVPPFDFTKGVPVLRVDCGTGNAQAGFDVLNTWKEGSVLYDVETDPGQTTSLENSEVIARLAGEIRAHMQAHDAPAALYDYYDLPRPGAKTAAPAASEKTNHNMAC